jgi:hypothetical protein
LIVPTEFRGAYEKHPERNRGRCLRLEFGIPRTTFPV